ncbi:hypothetical protein QRN89_18500 [Streptomyces chengbuensis]|uniref:hypothetical protein n=1 Tax=Streptomyces TaxID=1883 RepID=UPI0025B3F39D|nr:hypothetical protein [Streptomyces sp. HUAS CB01]WJY51613.1 hypothetical protein QRN89_18500 [Streptomyces sp. HUAS CB01]
MNADEREIRNLIDRWAERVHAGALDAVPAHHEDVRKSLLARDAWPARCVVGVIHVRPVRG